MPTGEAELGLRRRSAAASAGDAPPSCGRCSAGLPICSCRRSASPAGGASSATGCSAAPALPSIDFIAPPHLRAARRSAALRRGRAAASAAAIASPPVYDRARAAARYSDTMRELIQSFKYRDRQEGLPLFARWLSRAGAELLAEPISSCRCRSIRRGSGGGGSISRPCWHWLSGGLPASRSIASC